MLPIRDIASALFAMALPIAGCSEDDGGVDEDGTGEDSSAPIDCASLPNAIVTDIDETLTTSDEEWFDQIADGTHDPAARPGASVLINAYAFRGYRILYLTARPVTVSTSTGETAESATRRWLEEHGFPVNDRTELQLAPSFVVNSTAATYKAEALQQRQAAGWQFDYAYGNALSDIGGYDGAGIGKDVTFIIGEEAGAEGTQAILNEGWLEHSELHIPEVPVVCEPAL